MSGFQGCSMPVIWNQAGRDNVETIIQGIFFIG